MAVNRRFTKMGVDAGHDDAPARHPASFGQDWLDQIFSRARSAQTAAWCAASCAGCGGGRSAATPWKCRRVDGFHMIECDLDFVILHTGPMRSSADPKSSRRFCTVRFFYEKSTRPTLADMSNPLVIFTPSGKRGAFPVGTPVLTAARQLGVDLDSVCGGRGICSKCQVAPSYGDFPKHGVTVAADALSEWNAVEERYDRVRGLPRAAASAARPRFRATSSSTSPPKARCTARSCARPPPPAPSPWTRPRDRPCRGAEPDMHEPSGDLERLKAALAEQWEITGVTAPLAVLQRLQPALRKGNWQVSVALHRPANSDSTRSSASGPGCTRAGFTGLPSTLAPPRSRRISATSRTVACWPPRA
jgi:hypothetical protein